MKKDIIVSAEEYVSKLSDLNFMKIVAIARIQQTKKQFMEECKIQLIHAESIAIQVGLEQLIGIFSKDYEPEDEYESRYDVRGTRSRSHKQQLCRGAQPLPPLSLLPFAHGGSGASGGGRGSFDLFS